MHHTLTEVALPLPQINDVSPYDKMPCIRPIPKAPAIGGQGHRSSGQGHRNNLDTKPSPTPYTCQLAQL
jgi:hypothetical protein